MEHPFECLSGPKQRFFRINIGGRIHRLPTLDLISIGIDDNFNFRSCIKNSVIGIEQNQIGGPGFPPGCFETACEYRSGG